MVHRSSKCESHGGDGGGIEIGGCDIGGGEIKIGGSDIGGKDGL
jgi:hypothetical protein